MAFRFAPRYRVVWIALTGLVILTLISASEVFRTDSMSLVTALAGVLAIASAGQLLVIMSGGIDLSVPAVMTLAAAIVVHQSNGLDSRLGGAVVEVVLVCGLVGLINGVLVAVVASQRDDRHPGHDGRHRRRDGPVDRHDVLDDRRGPAEPRPARRRARRLPEPGGASSASGSSSCWRCCCARPRCGRSYVAAGTNRVAAEIIGVRVVYYELAGYVLAAVFYGIAGVFLAGLLSTPDFTLGDPYQLSTIIAVALGGAALAGGPASLVCTIGGCFFVALLGQFLQAKSYSGGVSQITNGVVLILAVAMVTVGSGGRLRTRLSPSRLLRR